MLAYKVLFGGRSGYTGWHWPAPEGDRPGEWVHADPGPLALCANGVHACTVSQLPQWLGEELWTIELAGEILEAEPAIVAARGRLIARVPAWDLDARTAFGESCAVRARVIGEGRPELGYLVDGVERFGSAGRAGPVGYWAAVLAGYHAGGQGSGSEYDAGFVREREAQARWLADELGLGS